MPSDTRPAPPPPDGQYRVLIIDPDLDAARLMIAAISKSRIMCVHAPGGAKGLQSWRAIEPHLIIAALEMEDKNGRDICARVRRESSVPIIITTKADDSEDYQLESLRLGADELLEKPFRPRLLMGRVVAHLRRVYDYDDCASAPPTATQENTISENTVSIGDASPMSDAEKARAANEVASAVQQIAATALTPPPNETRSAQKRNGQDDEATCDSCGYSGELQAFRAQPGENELICPQCGASGQIAFTLS